ncbi:MAG: CotH kinase family protein, partial [Oscillospiraceae bacterium]|nr:CotH kinase family protein [Oscillospiraceae bacterium]
YFDFAFSNVIGGAGNPGYQMTEMIKGLLRNEQFRGRFLTVFSELIKTNLSNENVLAEFDELIWTVEDEVSKDREKWEMSETGFYHRIEEFKNFVIENNYDQFCVEKVCKLLNVTPEERLHYFGE